jgi:hypothetical protein
MPHKYDWDCFGSPEHNETVSLLAQFWTHRVYFWQSTVCKEQPRIFWAKRVFTVRNTTPAYLFSLQADKYCWIISHSDSKCDQISSPLATKIQKISKVHPVHALKLCPDCTAHRGSTGIALPFLDHGARSGWRVCVTSRPLFTPGKDPVPIVQQGEWAPGPVWTGAENLTQIGIRSPDLPVRSQSL